MFTAFHALTPFSTLVPFMPTNLYMFFFSEGSGPFNFESGGSAGSLPKLHLNPYSWSKVGHSIGPTL
jgi:hypothetical protein